MMAPEPDRIRVSAEVSVSIEASAPIVLLESTVIAHGLPKPLNLETAIACEAAVRERRGMPATVGIVAGVPVVGMSREELAAFSENRAPDGSQIEKVSLNILSVAMAKRQWAATTVAGSLAIAAIAGLAKRNVASPVVLSTGGIGGVHRGASDSFDVSADLTALARIPLTCVCSGAKALLDLPKTLECLETIGVPVVGYGTEEFPAFYSQSSGLPVDAMVESPEEVAELVAQHRRSGSPTAVLVCVPAPGGSEIPRPVVEQAVREALLVAESEGVRGKALTPFLLSEMEKLTGGKTLAANRALLINNARVAAEIAVSISRR